MSGFASHAPSNSHHVYDWWAYVGAWLVRRGLLNNSVFQIRRLLTQISFDKTALTGCNMFSVKRGIILSVSFDRDGGDVVKRYAIVCCRWPVP